MKTEICLILHISKLAAFRVTASHGFDLKKIKVNLSFVLVYLREGGS